MTTPSQNNPVDGEKLPEDRDEQINQVASDVLAVVSPEGHDTEEWTQVRDAVAKNFPSAVPSPSAFKQAEMGTAESYPLLLVGFVMRLEREFYAHAGNHVRRGLAWRQTLKDFAGSQLAAMTAERDEAKEETKRFQEVHRYEHDDRVTLQQQVEALTRAETMQREGCDNNHAALVEAQTALAATTREREEWQKTAETYASNSDRWQQKFDSATRQNEELKGERESEKFKRADFAQKLIAEMAATDALRKEIEAVKAQWRMSSVCREKDAQLTAALALVEKTNRDAYLAKDGYLTEIERLKSALTLPADQPKQQGRENK